jgi:hypothetical protein
LVQLEAFVHEYSLSRGLVIIMYKLMVMHYRALSAENVNFLAVYLIAIGSA